MNRIQETIRNLYLLLCCQRSGTIGIEKFWSKLKIAGFFGDKESGPAVLVLAVSNFSWRDSNRYVFSGPMS